VNLINDIIFALFKLFIVPILFFFFYFLFALTAIIEKILTFIDTIIEEIMS